MNTRKLPFNEIVELKAPWIDEIKTITNDYIDRLTKQREAEAEYEGSTELLDEKYLYERFKDNCSSGMWNGNWEVFKYFILNFEIKIFKTMIGEWTFTDADKEMYEYFNNVQVNDKTKCKPSQIKVKSGTKITYDMLVYTLDRFIIYYEFEPHNQYDSNVIQEAYFNRFIKSFDCIENMKRNCKMTAKYADEDFFTSETLYFSRNYDGCLQSGNFTKLINVSTDEILSECKKIRYESINIRKENAQEQKIEKEFEEYCMKSLVYKALFKQLQKITIKLFKEFKEKSVTYKELPDSIKIKFEEELK